MDPFKIQIAKVMKRFQRGFSCKLLENPNAWQEFIEDFNDTTFNSFNKINQAFIVDLDC